MTGGLAKEAKPRGGGAEVGLTNGPLLAEAGRVKKRL